MQTPNARGFALHWNIAIRLAFIQCNYNVVCRCGCDLPKSECHNYLLKTQPYLITTTWGRGRQVRSEESQVRHCYVAMQPESVL